MRAHAKRVLGRGRRTVVIALPAFFFGLVCGAALVAGAWALSIMEGRA